MKIDSTKIQTKSLTWTDEISLMFDEIKQFEISSEFFDNEVYDSIQLGFDNSKLVRLHYSIFFGIDDSQFVSFNDALYLKIIVCLIDEIDIRYDTAWW